MRSRKASAVLVVIGCLTGLLAHVGLWARFVVFDEDGFSRAVVRASASSQVRSDLREAIVEQVVEGAEPRLIAARPLVEGAVDSVLSSAAFSRAIAAAAEDLHRSVFEEDSPTVTFQVASLVGRAQDLVRNADPNLANASGWEKAQRLPVTSQIYLDQARLVDRYVRILTILFTTLSLASLVGALWVSPNRRGTVLDIGVGVIAIAAVTLILTTVGATEIERRTPEAFADTARSVYEVFTATLRYSSLWLGATGLLMVAAAAARSPDHPAPSLFTPVYLGREWIAARSRRLAPGARSLLLIAAGGAMIYWHAAFVDLLVIAAGAWIGFVGLYGLLEVLGRYEERRTRLAVSPRSVWVALTAVLTVVIIAGLLQSKAPAKPLSVPGNDCNGDVKLCALPLDAIVFPGTHNSMAASSEQGWFNAYQDQGIGRQLRDGIRAFLIDTYYGRPGPQNLVFTEDPPSKPASSEPVSPQDAARAEELRRARGAPTGNRDVYLCHAFCELGATSLVSVLTEVKEFLKDHPREVLILFLQDEVQPADTAAVFARTGLLDRLYTPEPGKPWPTLGEMVDTRRQIVVLSENYGPEPAWYASGFKLAQDTPYNFPSVEAINCAPNRGPAEAPLLLANHWVERVPPNPTEAERANNYDRLLRQVNECESQRGQKPNILAVDFYARGDLLEVADVLNGVRPAR